MQIKGHGNESKIGRIGNWETKEMGKIGKRGIEIENKGQKEMWIKGRREK